MLTLGLHKIGLEAFRFDIGIYNFYLIHNETVALNAQWSVVRQYGAVKIQFQKPVTPIEGWGTRHVPGLSRETKVYKGRVSYLAQPLCHLNRTRFRNIIYYSFFSVPN